VSVLVATGNHTGLARFVQARKHQHADQRHVLFQRSQVDELSRPLLPPERAVSWNSGKTSHGLGLKTARPGKRRQIRFRACFLFGRRLRFRSEVGSIIESWWRLSCFRLAAFRFGVAAPPCCALVPWRLGIIHFGFGLGFLMLQGGSLPGKMRPGGSGWPLQSSHFLIAYPSIFRHDRN